MFNLFKASQTPGDPYQQRFEKEPGAVIKNGKGAPQQNVGDGVGTPITLNDDQGFEPLKMNTILRALGEIAHTGQLLDSTRIDPQLKEEMDQLLTSNGPEFAKLSAMIGNEGDLTAFYNFILAKIQNNSPVLFGDKGKNQEQAEIYRQALLKYINGDSKMASEKYNFKKFSAEKDEEEAKGPKTSYEKEQTEKEKRKGKGGNPFRVLMGIVGKLLDKGWNQQDVVRHVKRHTKFQAKTIKECVKIMKQYNKKKERDRIEKKSRSFNLKEVFAATAIERAERKVELGGIYDIEQDFQKKSTRELQSRLYYLECASNFDEASDNDTRTNGPKGNLSSVSEEITKVVSALKNRGWSDKDVEDAKKIVKSDRYYPFETNVEEDEEDYDVQS